MKRSTSGALGSPIDLPLDGASQEFSQSQLDELQPELPLDPPEPDELSGEPGSGDGHIDLHQEGNGVTAGRRATGGILDLGVHLGVLAVAVGGSLWLGVSASSLSWLPLLVLIGCFSFVYHVLPLTFWGHTPGMARVGLVARSSGGGGPLTIGQAVLRWLGALLSIASLGLLLVLMKERSPSDRLSKSTVRG